MTLSHQALHAYFNAGLNATSGILVVLAVQAIRNRQRERHKKLMLSAFAVSTVFLVSYLARFAMAGEPTPFNGEGLFKYTYLAILFSHMLLAAAVPFLALRSIYLGLNGRDAVHRRWGKITFPIWLYVSITGVIVTFLLWVYPGRPG
jgi:uncharacterized membrane protein YozB (DUF420 family)